MLKDAGNVLIVERHLVSLPATIRQVGDLRTQEL